MKAVFRQDDKEMVRRVIELTGAVPMLDKIASSQLSVIAEHMEIVELEPGGVLFSEGENSDYMCFVAAGKLDVRKRSEKGKNVVVSSLTRGRSIGEMALIDAFPRSASVVAASNCTLLVINRDSFEHILDQHPRAGIAFLKGIARLLSLNLRRVSGLLADAS